MCNRHQKNGKIFLRIELKLKKKSIVVNGNNARLNASLKVVWGFFHNRFTQRFIQCSNETRNHEYFMSDYLKLANSEKRPKERESPTLCIR